MVEFFTILFIGGFIAACCVLGIFVLLSLLVVLLGGPVVLGLNNKK